LNFLEPIPARLLKSKVHEIAESVAEQLSFQPGDPMEPLVAKLGGRITLRSPVFGENQLSESIRVEPDRKFTIYVSSITSAERDRFTIAHELGHLFLHFPQIKKANPDAGMIATRWVSDTDQEQRRAEWEANWFAAAFLMPKVEFRRVFSKRAHDLRSVASYFGVSAHAVQVRAKTLELV
jgi:predicted transcriptional regulator